MAEIIKKKRTLDEVAFIRPVLIVLLVLYHSFAPWCGAWDAFDGFSSNVLYKAIGRLSYSFMLPMFVFISGYVWAFQREGLCRIDTFAVLLKKKLKRLYIPSLLFSFLYLVMFGRNEMGGGNLALSILGGFAHMWFLPMLLWCFVICYVVLCIRDTYIQCFIVLTLFLLSTINIPFQISSSFYYIVFFYTGYKFWRLSKRIKISMTLSRVVYSWCLFGLLYVLLTGLNSFMLRYLNIDSCVGAVLWKESYNIIKILYGFAGILALFFTAVYYTKIKTLPNIIVKVGEYCFGVYLFQQFILHGLYYNTHLPQIIGVYLPWIGFLITLTLSLLISILIKQFKWGRALI